MQQFTFSMLPQRASVETKSQLDDDFNASEGGEMDEEILEEEVPFDADELLGIASTRYQSCIEEKRKFG